MSVIRRTLICTGLVAVLWGFLCAEAYAEMLGSWQHTTLLWRIEFRHDGQVYMMTIGQPTLGQYWLDADMLTVRMADGQLFRSKMSVTDKALVLTDQDGTSNTFVRVQVPPPHNPYIDTYKDGQDDVNTILDASLGSIDETYRGTHQYFRDDMIGLIVSGLAAHSSHQVVGSIKTALEGRSGAELRMSCEAYIKTFPDDPIDISFGGPVSVSMTLGKLCSRVLAQQRGGQ
jgi:hypothetical protein